MRQRLLGARHPSIASSQVVLATLQIAQHHYPDALETARSATDIYTESLSATHWRTAAAMSAQGAALTGLGRYREAEPLLTRSEAILSDKDSGAPPIFRTLNERYLETLRQRERPASQAKLTSLAAPSATAASATTHIAPPLAQPSIAR